MNAKKIVSLSNSIGLISIFLLVYWVFIFVSMEVFGLKVFRENMTQTFYFSVLGILALMVGALIINVMMNLTRIAQKHNNDETIERKRSKAWLAAFILSFPFIFGVLVIGDSLTSAKKEKLLISSAKSIIDSNTSSIKLLSEYRFEKKWANQVADVLKLMSKTDNNFKTVSLIVKDQVGETQVFLRFNQYDYFLESRNFNKVDFVCDTSLKQREYLNKVFKEQSTKVFFEAHDGNYDLFYPIQMDGKIVVLHFSDSMRYGKIGS